jgi:hypothetical protein
VMEREDREVPFLYIADRVKQLNMDAVELSLINYPLRIHLFVSFLNWYYGPDAVLEYCHSRYNVKKVRPLWTYSACLLNILPDMILRKSSSMDYRMLNKRHT